MRPAGLAGLSGHRGLSGFLATLLFLAMAATPALLAQSGSSGPGLYYRNFVRHADGTFCTHMPPVSSFVAFLNGDSTQILTEQAPRWDEGADPNIDGKGTFGVELGNFPSLSAGDTVTVVFTCLETNEQGRLTEIIPEIPWPRFPRTLQLHAAPLPEPIQDLRLSFDTRGHRLLTWASGSGGHILVYRRNLADTVRCNVARRLYSLVAAVGDSGRFLDRSDSASGHAYLLVRTTGAGLWSAHSAEVVDFPAAPVEVVASVASTDPWAVAISWQGQDTGVAQYAVFRDSLSRCGPDSSGLLGTTSATSWIDHDVREGQTWCYTVAAINRNGVMGPASDPACANVVPSPHALPDLDVLFISRTPRYPRYRVVYDPPGYNPHESPETEGVKHYPDPGELVHYTATIRNNGGKTVDRVTVVWRVDSVEVRRVDAGPLFAGQRLRSVLTLPWSEDPVWVACQALAADSVHELTLANNSVAIRSNALSFHFHVERGLARVFETHVNPLGSYSFEDWAQFELRQLARFFREACYPDVTPNGIPEAVFLDTVSVVEDGTLPPGGTHAPESELWDGHWGFTSDSNAVRYFRDQVLGANHGVDWALLHELGHQLGLIDLYQMDVAKRQLLVIEPRTGKKPQIQPIAWDVLYYCSRKDHLMHSNFQAGFSDHSAGALKRNAGRRRGFYGEYLADMPRENAVRVRKIDGTPVANAEIWVYQKQDGVIPDVRKFSGTTDSAGLYWFPHRADSAYGGGIRVRHPFSSVFSQSPHAVGTNATLFFRVARGDSVGYAFLDICPFNVAFWAGHRDSAVVDLVVKNWLLLPDTRVRGFDRPSARQPTVLSAYPNPFNATVVLAVETAKPGRVEIAIFDQLGRLVRTLAREVPAPGLVRVVWNGADDRGLSLSSGVYLAVARFGGNTLSRKIVLLR